MATTLSYFPRLFLNGNAVAGQGAEGNGILIGWEGLGEMTRARLLELAAAAEVPIAWLMAPKDPGVQLTRAIREIAGPTYNAERVRQPTRYADGERRWSSRWLMVTRAPEGDAPIAPGQTFGEIALVATLYQVRGEDDAPTTYELVLDGPETLGTRVRNAYDARCGAERYVAADITKWLSDTIRDRLAGVRYGGNWYIPRPHRILAESICSVFGAVWGRNWMIPLPIATSAQLALGLGIGLQGEVDDVLHELAAMRKSARANGNADIGERGATSVMERLVAVGERIVMYSDLLGPENTDDCRNRIHDAMVELDGVLGAVDFTTQWATIARPAVEEGLEPS